MAQSVGISLLGPVAVHGAAEPFRRSAALDLVAYLAIHRRGVRHAEWALAVWPDRAVALSTMHSTASDVRRALGRAPDGTPFLPRGVRLRLHDSVTSDVERFASLADSDDLHRVVEAMHLVRGPLFDGLRRCDWAVFDGTRSRIESLVVGTALHCADELTRLGDGSRAAWVVRQALRVSPYDERLYRALLRATATQGGRAGVRSTMADLLTLAGEAERPAVGWSRVDPGGDARLESLHPETRGLYRDLLGWSPAAGGHPSRL